MRTAGALKLNEQLQPVGTQMGYLRSEHCEKSTYPCIHVKHPRGLEFIGVIRAKSLREALYMANI